MNAAVAAPFNPFAPPLSEVLGTAATERPLPDLGARLLARLIDLAVLLGPFAVGAGPVFSGALLVAICLPVWAGASLGKRLLGLRVVTTDGLRASGLRQGLRMVARYGLTLGGTFALGGVPIIPILGLTLIFWRGRRAAHDWIAGTKVTRVPARRGQRNERLWRSLDWALADLSPLLITKDRLICGDWRVGRTDVLSVRASRYPSRCGDRVLMCLETVQGVLHVDLPHSPPILTALPFSVDVKPETPRLTPGRARALPLLSLTGLGLLIRLFGL